MTTRELAIDARLLLGVALIAVGLWLVHPALAFLGVGGLLLVEAVLAALDHRRATARRPGDDT